LPTGYYAIRVPGILKKDLQEISLNQRHELERLGELCNTEDRYSGFVSILFDRMIPQSDREEKTKYTLKQLLEENGFDAGFHEQIKADLKRGRIGLAQNRISVSANIEDVSEQEVFNAMERLDGKYEELGAEALKNGELAIVSLAGGAGSRWTKGAGVVKSLNPFVKMQGKYRNFIEIHLAKSRKVSTATNQALPHIFTTSYLTHQALDDHLQTQNNYDYPGPLYLSRGKSIGLRLVPMERDLRFEWEEMPQQLLDEQAQKMQESVHNALIGWARSMGEGEDYTDNLPAQCVHPVGHWYEVPNLFLNGTLLKLLTEQPALKYLMIHNIDTLGANADPALLGWHIHSGKVMNTEVITRRLEDRGGGLAKINGTLRLVEGMALPDEKIEFQLSYYNSSTTWVDIDQLLQVFGLTKDALKDRETVQKAVRTVANRMPTYITIKDVKKRWGKGQEDVFPVAQFEKLWGDMTALAGLNCGFMLVPRMRGQQLKEISQLDGWLRDGSADYVNGLCNWDN
jgi:UDP-N-acetylglucosamine pyrophosphorylase